MVLKWNNPLVTLWFKLPTWFAYIEAVRVGSDCYSYCKIGLRTGPKGE